MKPKNTPKRQQLPKKASNIQVSAQNRNPFLFLLQNETFLVLFILLATFLCFLPTLSADFIPSWDDNAYITDNLMIRSISLTSLKQMFTSQVGGTYVPLPLLSYAIEYKIWGLNPVAVQFTNVLLHLACVFLVFRILCSLKLDGFYAAAGALIYGIHPMGVESVAWVTERKDLLYGVFYFGSLLLYLHYVRLEKRKKILFAGSLALFVLALFSKIQAVSLPLVLLAVDYFYQRPLNLKLLFEKVPYFFLSLIFGVAGIFVLQSVGALKVNEIYTFTERFFFGIFSLSSYLLKFFAPTNMSALYPYPVRSGSALPLVYYLSPVFILLLGFAVYRTANKTRAVAFGALFFLLSIVFMLQIFGAGAGFLADRYIKVPYLGLVFLVGWALQQNQEKWKKATMLVWFIFVVFSIFLMVLTYSRCKIWKNGGTLWTDVIEKYPGKEARPYSCRAVYYRSKGETDKTLADLNMTLAIDNRDAEMTLMRGNIYFGKGKDDLAYSDYIRVLKLKTDNSLAYGNLGAIYVRRNQLDSAVTSLTKSLELDSSFAASYANRAVAYGGMGKTLESIEDFKRYLIYKPDDEKVFTSLAVAYRSLGRFEDCIEWLDKAIALKPDFGTYYSYRSETYNSIGNKAKALADAQKAKALGIAISPEYIRSLQ